MIKFFCLSFIISSCALTRGWWGGESDVDEVVLTNYSVIDTDDYVSQLNAYKDFLIKSEELKILRLSVRNQQYIRNLALMIVKNNELFFTNLKDVAIHIAIDSLPFHFSLPGGHLFLSTGLIKRYLKSEDLIVSVLTYELIRSEKNIYRKGIIAPTGFMSLQRMLGQMMLTTKEKMAIHKWAFYLLKRSGVDTVNYLSWIQVQNRNSLDFSHQHGDVASISQEESLFKSFLIENKNKMTSNRKYEGSPREYYEFIKQL